MHRSWSWRSISTVLARRPHKEKVLEHQTTPDRAPPRSWLHPTGARARRTQGGASAVDVRGRNPERCSPSARRSRRSSKLSKRCPEGVQKLLEDPWVAPIRPMGPTIGMSTSVRCGNKSAVVWPGPVHKLPKHCSPCAKLGPTIPSRSEVARDGVQKAAPRAVRAPR